MVGLQKSDKTATKMDEDEMKAARALGGRAFVEGVVSDEITNIVSESAKAAAVETSQGILRAADEARDKIKPVRIPIHKRSINRPNEQHAFI